MDKVASSIRMLGAGFFHDVTGQKRNKGKTYDQATLVAESQDIDEESSSILHADGNDEIGEEEMFETLVQEGDEDASLIADFESAAADILQGDEDLASAYTAYVEARRRLNEKTRFRGFWPVSQSTKGKSKGGFKGRGKSSKGFSNRKSLQQRILESRCRICNRVGHWKAECPHRNNQSESAVSSRGSASQVPTSFVSAQTESLVTDGGLPLEFLQLPSHGPGLRGTCTVAPRVSALVNFPGCPSALPLRLRFHWLQARFCVLCGDLEGREHLPVHLGTAGFGGRDNEHDGSCQPPIRNFL